MTGRSCFLLLALAFAATAVSQPYPARPVRFVVPFAPGGSVDTLARTVGPKLADAVGQQIVVDNRPGGNGDIGMLIVAKAPPDGYTILLGYIANLAIAPSLSWCSGSMRWASRWSARRPSSSAPISGRKLGSGRRS